MVPELFAAIRAQIVACFPEVDWQANGIYRAREMKYINFENKAKVGELPLMLVSARLTGDTSGRFPAAAFTRVGSVRIIRVDADANEPGVNDADLAEAAMRALITQLETTDLAFGQRIGPCDLPDDSEDLVVNQYFLLTRKPFWGVAISVPVVIMERYV